MKQGQDFVRKYNLIGYLECSSLSRFYFPHSETNFIGKEIKKYLMMQLRLFYYETLISMVFRIYICSLTKVEDEKEGDGGPKPSEDSSTSNASQVDTSSQVPKLFDSSKSLTSLNESQQATSRPSTEQNGSTTPSQVLVLHSGLCSRFLPSRNFPLLRFF